jgi:hypothetical protein
MYFPPLYADQDTLINFPGASVDGNGNVTGKSERTVHVKMLNGDPEKLSRANYMRVRIKFNTSGQNNNPVKFKTDDTIDISSWGLIDYKVNGEGSIKNENENIIIVLLIFAAPQIFSQTGSVGVKGAKSSGICGVSQYPRTDYLPLVIIRRIFFKTFPPKNLSLLFPCLYPRYRQKQDQIFST